MAESYCYKGPDRNDNIYCFLGEDTINDILSCGYMHKPTEANSQYQFMIHYYSAFVLLKGKGYYIDAEGNKTALYPGCMVQRLPGIVHSTEVIPDGEWVEFYMTFGKSTFDYLDRLGIIMKDSPVLQVTLSSGMVSRFDELLSKVKNAKQLELSHVLLQMQQELIGVYQTVKNSPIYIEKDEDVIIHRACNRLGRDFREEVTGESIAQELYINYETFRKKFKKEMGVSPGDYRTHKKMQVAQAMLIGGESIKHIASELGYSDQYAFSKQFKKTVGMAPKFYTQHLQEQFGN